RCPLAAPRGAARLGPRPARRPPWVPGRSWLPPTRWCAAAPPPAAGSGRLAPDAGERRRHDHRVLQRPEVADLGELEDLGAGALGQAPGPARTAEGVLAGLDAEPRGLDRVDPRAPLPAHVDGGAVEAEDGLAHRAVEVAGHLRCVLGGDADAL